MNTQMNRISFVKNDSSWISRPSLLLLVHKGIFSANWVDPKSFKSEENSCQEETVMNIKSPFKSRKQLERKLKHFNFAPHFISTMNCTSFPAICSILRAKIDGTFLSKADPLPPPLNTSFIYHLLPSISISTTEATPTSSTEAWLIATTCVTLGTVVIYQLGKYGNR